nr:MAG TPA: hypothetical protein [Bacteriophage sp.]
MQHQIVISVHKYINLRYRRLTSVRQKAQDFDNLGRGYDPGRVL